MRVIILFTFIFNVNGKKKLTPITLFLFSNIPLFLFGNVKKSDRGGGGTRPYQKEKKLNTAMSDFAKKSKSHDNIFT